MNKPDVKTVLEVLRMKDEAAKLYNQIDEMIRQFSSEFGTGRFDYDLEEFLDEHNPDNDYYYDEALLDGGRYLKFEITDNIQAMKDGNDVWKSVAFKPLSFVIQSLKRCPDSLK